jgi:indole-3-glycerol phosphate synthase
MSLLEEIIALKKREVEERKKIVPVEGIDKNPTLGSRNFMYCLQKEGISLIAEIKRMSPSGGMIREHFDLVGVAEIYEQNGADVISVLTDEKYFGGRIEYLRRVKQSVRLPVLQKDFIVDEYQLYESCFFGADAVLLIARVLTRSELDRFIQRATELGLACMVEVHSMDELEDVLCTGAEIVGINNRNLDTLEIDLNVSLKLIKMIPEGYTVVSESGIRRREDVRRLEEMGFDGILVGESIMRAVDMGEKMRSLKGITG